MERERKQREQREAEERYARAARLAALFEEDEEVASQDDEDMLDAAVADQGVKHFIEKIETHLQVERRLLEAWQEKDAQAADLKEESPERVEIAK